MLRFSIGAAGPGWRHSGLLRDYNKPVFVFSCSSKFYKTITYLSRNMFLYVFVYFV